MAELARPCQANDRHKRHVWTEPNGAVAICPGIWPELPAPELSEQYRLLICLEQISWVVGYLAALGRSEEVDFLADTVTDLVLYLGRAYLDCDPQGVTGG